MQTLYCNTVKIPRTTPNIKSLDGLKIKDLLQLLHGVLRSVNRVANGARIHVDLVVVPTRETLVTKEVNSLVLDSGNALLSLDVLQAISLVPAIREDIERDLTSN